MHLDGTIHTHDYDNKEHTHASKSQKELTPWMLFIIFVLGPCEPLIPLIMYPAIQESVFNTFLVVLFFGVATLIAMLGMVLATVYGAAKLTKFSFFERYGNSMAGVVICGCGLAIKFLGI
jgi:sulfite exporter TauE/SafE